MISFPKRKMYATETENTNVNISKTLTKSSRSCTSFCIHVHNTVEILEY